MTRRTGRRPSALWRGTWMGCPRPSSRRRTRASPSSSSASAGWGSPSPHAGTGTGPLLPWFLAIQGWYQQLTESGNPRTMAEWWASTWSITGLQKAWREVTARCETKGGEHFHLVEGKEVPLPTIDEVIRAHLAYARDHPRAERSRRSNPG
jgi:hypothetical protein